MLFHLQMFGDFSVVFLLLLSKLLPLWQRTYSLYDFNSFKCVEIYFVAQDMAYVYLGEYSLSAWKKCVICVNGWASCVCVCVCELTLYNHMFFKEFKRRKK